MNNKIEPEMKKKVGILFLVVCIGACSNAIKTESKTVSETEEPIEYEYYRLHKLFVVGDFDGDGEKDTLFLHHYSNITKTEIDSFPYPKDLEDWYDFVRYHDNQDIASYLTFNKKNKDTLHFGQSQILGLYCLINIGDNNSDGKDEIALVVNFADWTNMNACMIYTLCNEKWTLLKEFEIDEHAFDFSDGEMPVFQEIRGYLEKRNGKWFYLDFLEDFMGAETDEIEMKPLKIEKCK